MADAKNLKISKATINDVTIQAENILLVEIYESLNQPGITGKIQILDFQAIVEIGNVFAGDDLTLEFASSDKSKKPLTNKFKIYSLEGTKLLPNQNYNTVVFGFCSSWLMDGLTKKVSKVYKNKFIHEIMEDLLKESGAKIGFIEQSKQKLENFVTPLWTPYHSIKYLSSYTLSKDGNAGYICWTDLKTDKVNITSLGYLVKGSLGKFKTFTLYPGNDRYEGKINHCTIETNYDTIRLVNNGLPKTKVYGFNFNKGKVVSTDKDISDLSYKHLSKKIPIPSSFDFEKYSSFSFVPLFPNNKDSIASKDDSIQDLLDGYVLNTFTLMSIDVIKVNAIVHGDSERRVGWLADVDFPSQEINDGNKEGNKQLKGEYLIRDIKHMFSYHKTYEQAITLVADGYKEFKRNEIMSW